MINFLLEISRSKERYSFIQIPDIICHIKSDSAEIILWGDPIMPDSFESLFCKGLTIQAILNQVNGHYYFLLINRAKSSIILGNSHFSILPVYYHQINDIVYFSNNVMTIAKHCGNREVCKRFVLETVLFNYPLFNHTIFEGINLLSSNSLAEIINQQITIKKHTSIENCFPGRPLPWRRAANNISDLFLSRVKFYLPTEPYFTALTGGFDGRTLVAAGLYHKREFSTYTFGTDQSNDMAIAMELAQKVGLQHYLYELNEDYSAKEQLKNGLDFVLGASGSSTFARAHYLYTAKQISLTANHVITGNFGSELFRAAHNPGVMFSENVIALFRQGSLDKALESILASPEATFLNQATYQTAWESLKEDLPKLPCTNPEYKTLSQNQQFYIFVLEEVFRKYFGAEMVNQFSYIRNRTPFLDIEFVRELFKTGLAGIHSDFFEHNPFKRYKGQITYAHIIKKAYPLFGSLLTDKGYRPDDLLSIAGNWRILQGYMLKKLTKNKYSDPYGVKNSFLANADFYKSMIIPPELFSVNKDFDYFGLNQSLLYKILSLSYMVVKGREI